MCLILRSKSPFRSNFKSKEYSDLIKRFSMQKFIAASGRFVFTDIGTLMNIFEIDL